MAVHAELLNLYLTNINFPTQKREGTKATEIKTLPLLSCYVSFFLVDFQIFMTKIIRSRLWSADVAEQADKPPHESVKPNNTTFLLGDN